MPVDKRLTDLTSGTVVHADDWLLVVDIHDTTMDPTGTDKKVSPAVLSAALSLTTSQITDLSSWAGSTSLTTLGTITAGTWHGSVIALTYLDATLVNTAASYANPAWITSLAGSKVSGNITGNAASITGSITESQVTGLITDLAAKATDSLVVHLAGTETIAGAKTFSTAPVLGTLTGLLKAATGTLTAATAGTDYLTPSGSGAALTGITASQIGSVPTGLLKGSAGSLAAAGSADLPTITLTGDVTGSASGGSIAASIPAGTITSAQQANVSASALRGNPTGSAAAPSDITLGPNLSFIGSTLRSRVPFAWVIGSGTAVANSTAQTSLFSGATLGGSLTIPANTLQVGSYLRLELFGTWGSAGSPTLNVQVSLGGTVIMQGTSAALATASGNQWLFDHLTGTGALVQAIGASGKIIGLESFAATGGARWGLNSSGTQSVAPAQVTINTTLGLALDVKVQWSAASASNTIQLTAGAVYLDF